MKDKQEIEEVIMNEYDYELMLFDRKAIEKVGKERIKKYYFDIDDADCEKQKEEK